jgi:hypothetical protein
VRARSVRCAPAAEHLVVMVRSNGVATPVVHRLVPGTRPAPPLNGAARFNFSEPSYSLQLGDQGPPESGVLRLVYSSLRTPASTIDIAMATGHSPPPGHHEGSHQITHPKLLAPTTPAGVRRALREVEVVQRGADHSSQPLSCARTQAVRL